jgi:hypothetical protein
MWSTNLSHQISNFSFFTKGAEAEAVAFLIDRIPSGLAPGPRKLKLFGALIKQKLYQVSQRKSFTVSLVCPAKYRRKTFSQEVSKSLLEVCFDITVKYEIEFIEVGSDNDHVHFLIQGIPV